MIIGKSNNNVKRVSGFALQTAILLMLLLAALGIAVMRVATSVEADSYYDAAADRAYQAANTGLMLAEKQLDASMATAGATMPTSCASVSPLIFNTAFVVPLAVNSGLSREFRVTVTCDGLSSSGASGYGESYSEGFGTTYIFSLTAIACNSSNGICIGSAGAPSGSGAPYVERQLKAIYFLTPPNQ